MATTMSSASSPSRSRMVKAPRKVDGVAALLRGQRPLGLVEQSVERGDPLAHLAGVAAAGDGGAKLAHRRARPAPSAPASRAASIGSTGSKPSR